MIWVRSMERLMSKTKSQVPEWDENMDRDLDECEREAEESYRSAGKPTRCPHKRGLRSLVWTLAQQRIWSKKHGF